MAKKKKEVIISAKNLDDYETSFIKKMQAKITDRIGVIVELDLK